MISEGTVIPAYSDITPEDRKLANSFAGKLVGACPDLEFSFEGSIFDYEDTWSITGRYQFKYKTRTVIGYIEVPGNEIRSNHDSGTTQEYLEVITRMIRKAIEQEKARINKEKTKVEINRFKDLTIPIDKAGAIKLADSIKKAVQK